MRVIKWLDGRIDALRGSKVRYCTGIGEFLYCGPHHVDLATQHLMRRCYFRGLVPRTDHFAEYLEILQSQEKVIFWCDPDLPSCLSLLWALELLTNYGVDFGNAYLATVRGIYYREPIEPTDIQCALDNLVPVSEVCDALIRLRRYLASDSETIEIDLSPFPPQMRDWVSTAGSLADFLPDERGLDIVDSIFLDFLGSKWMTAAEAITEFTVRTPREHAFPDLFLWERLIELGGCLSMAPVDENEGLLTLEVDGVATMARTRVKLSSLGKRARDGQIDAYERLPMLRWVGGRQITSDRPRRRPWVDTRRLKSP